MTCAELLRWLDEGREPALARAASSHGATCPACARALRADEAIEAALVRLQPVAPPGFTARVMARIDRDERARAGAPLPALGAPALPWWIRVAGEPATVMALLAAGLLLWGWDPLWTLAAGATAWVASGPAVGVIAAPPWAAGLGAHHLLEAALACLALFYSDALYRWALRLAGRPRLLRGSR